MAAATRGRRKFLRHPSQVVALAFAAAILVGAVLLSLPIATHDPGRAPFVTSLFTATSAICVTGLSTVDTPNYWTPFGQVVILVLVQIGGFGVMTLASLLGLVLARKVGLRTRVTTAQETKSQAIGDLRSLLLGVLRVTVVIESVTAIALVLRWWLGYGESLGRAAYLGVFHAVSAFNNAGFALFSDSLMSYATDPLIVGPISIAVTLGGIGFPVIMELLRQHKPHRWSLHTKITLLMTSVLFVGGAILLTALEWNNPQTLGTHHGFDKLLVGLFHSVAPRSSGFNTWDNGAIEDGTLIATIALMFIGGGSAGTAGGIKVTTFFLLLIAIIAEVRGEEDATAFDRRIDSRAMRQALTVALIGIAAIISGTIALTQMTHLPLRDAMFETTSAYATVGLSTGVTPELPPSAQILVSGLMFFGRLGPITLVSALAIRESSRRYKLPEGRPIIG